MFTSKITAFVTNWTHRSVQRRQVQSVVCASTLVERQPQVIERDFKIIITREDNQKVMIAFNGNHAAYIVQCFTRYLKLQEEEKQKSNPLDGRCDKCGYRLGDHGCPGEVEEIGRYVCPTKEQAEKLEDVRRERIAATYESVLRDEMGV